MRHVDGVSTATGQFAGKVHQRGCLTPVKAPLHNRTGARLPCRCSVDAEPQTGLVSKVSSQHLLYKQVASPCSTKSDPVIHLGSLRNGPCPTHRPDFRLFLTFRDQHWRLCEHPPDRKDIISRPRDHLVIIHLYVAIHPHLSTFVPLTQAACHSPPPPYLTLQLPLLNLQPLVPLFSDPIFLSLFLQLHLTLLSTRLSSLHLVHICRPLCRRRWPFPQPPPPPHVTTALHKRGRPHRRRAAPTLSHHPRARLPHRQRRKAKLQHSDDRVFSVSSPACLLVNCRRSEGVPTLCCVMPNTLVDISANG